MTNTKTIGRRGARLAAATAIALLLASILMLAPAAEPAEAGTRKHLPPRVAANQSSVAVDEGQTATNSGTYSDTRDRARDTVTISASKGKVTQTGTDKGTWSWSLETKDVCAEQTEPIKITAKDSTGRSKTTSFQLTTGDRSPTNDCWEKAEEIQDVPGPGNDQWAKVTGDTGKANKEAGEPSPSLSGIDCGNSGVSNSVWYKVTPQKSGWLYLTTEGSSFDTVLGVYEGSSIDTLSQVDCSNENFGANGTDKMSAKVTANKTYYVQLSGTGGAHSGAYTLKTRLHFGPDAWPSADWRPYASTIPWYQKLPDTVPTRSNSTEIVKRLIDQVPYGTPEGGLARNDQAANLVLHDDGSTGEPTYYSKPRDPKFTLNCTEFGGNCTVDGKTISIPAGALVEGHGTTQTDRHLTVVDQAEGIEYDLWQVKTSPILASGGVLNISWGGYTRFFDGDGRAHQPDAAGRFGDGTAAGFADLAGRLRIEELEGPQPIDHALFITVPCHDGTKVEPANKTASFDCTKQKVRNPDGTVKKNPDGTDMTLLKDNAPPLGARLRLNMTPQDIDALPIPDWKKKIVRAMRDYGALIGDTGNSFYFSVETESGNQYTSMGSQYTDKWTDFAEANDNNGWDHDTSCGSGGYCPTHWKSTMHNDATKNPNEATFPYKGETFNWKKHVWSNLVVVDECASLPDPAKRCI